MTSSLIARVSRGRHTRRASVCLCARIIKKQGRDGGGGGGGGGVLQLKQHGFKEQFHPFVHDGNC